MARQNRGLVIALIIFVAVAVAVRFFGDPLWDMFMRLHGAPPAGH